jgi:hypothetical protein
MERKAVERESGNIIDTSLARTKGSVEALFLHEPFNDRHDPSVIRVPDIALHVWTCVILRLEYKVKNKIAFNMPFFEIVDWRLK